MASEIYIADQIRLTIKDYKPEQSYTSLATKIAQQEEERNQPRTWADICDVESDEETGLLTLMEALLDKDNQEDKIDPNTVLLPKDFGKFHPTWERMIALACKFCKLELKESEKVTISGVSLAGLWSADDNERSNARQSAKDNNKETYSAYNSLNHILDFFGRPIDLKKVTNPSPGQAWILYKIAYDWNKRSFGDDFDPALFRAGTKHGDLRSTMVSKTKILYPKGSSSEIAEMIISALDAIVYKYIQKCYRCSKKQASNYIKDVVGVVSKDGKKFVASHLRTTVTTENRTINDGKKKKTVQEQKTSYLQPWVHKDELHTPEEKAIAGTVNAVFKDLGGLIDSELGLGPMGDALGAQKVMEHAWRISDMMNGISKKRKKSIRNLILSKREDDKKRDKITPTEWESAAVELARKDEVKTNYQEIFRELGYDAATDSIGESDISDLLSESFREGAKLKPKVSLVWGRFKDAFSDPVRAHAMLVDYQNQHSEPEGDY
jgi:hypothetical protein